jgi:hypothetical protein
VTTDDRNHAILMDEPVLSEHLAEGFAAEALIERVAWSIDDAESVEAAFRVREAIAVSTIRRARDVSNGRTQRRLLADP